MTMSAELLRLIERKTGQSIEQLQKDTLWQQRRQAEAKRGQPMRLLRLFPFIGRGSIMGNYVLSHREVDRQLDRAVR